MIKGEKLELTIEGVGMDGEGVAKHDGIVVFVPMTLVGEVVEATITFVKKKFATARVYKVLQASPMRRDPICPIFFQCGGCSMMHIEYDAQLEIKKENVANCMRKVAKIDSVVDDVVACSNEYEYRNKIQLPIANLNGEIVCGFYREKSHIVEPFNKCYLHGVWADDIIDAFLDWANRYKLTAYDEKTGRGLLRHLVLRKLGDVIAIVVVINGSQLPEKDKLSGYIHDMGYKFSMYININKSDTNVIMSDKTTTIYGKTDILHEIADVKLSVAPNAFMQVNDEIAEKIYFNIADKISKHNKPLVLECYSGIGMLSNIIARSTDRLVSVEIEYSATKNANTMATLNGNADKILNICGDAGVVMPSLAAFSRGSEDATLEYININEDEKVRLANMLSVGGTNQDIVVVLDPPRKGCDACVLDAVIAASPNFIYYISCSPSTLARDIAVLKEKYDVVSITPYDMFPNTSHVETLVQLKAKA